MANTKVTANVIADDAVTLDKLADNVSDTYATKSYVLTGSGPTISSLF